MGKSDGTQLDGWKKDALETATVLSRKAVVEIFQRPASIVWRRLRALSEDEEFPLAHELWHFASTTCSSTSTPSKSSP